MEEDLQKHLEKRLGSSQQRELVAQQKRREATTQRERRKELANERHNQTLLRALEPKKNAPKKRKTAEVVQWRHGLEADFAIRMERLQMLAEDRCPDTVAYRNLVSLRDAMPSFLFSRDREMAVAAEADARLARREAAERREAEAQKLRAAHAQSMRKVFVEIDENHGRGCKIKKPRKQKNNIQSYFVKKRVSFEKQTEKAFERFYFDTLIERPQFNEATPVAITDEVDSESEEDELPYDMCTTCRIPLVTDASMGALTCQACGVMKRGGFGVGFKQTFNESQASVRSAAPYERISHFKEFIARLEGSEKTTIPEQIIHNVLKYCANYDINPITEPEKITYTFLRRCLHQIDQANFFKNISQIRCLICRQRPRFFTEAQKARLEQSFRSIQPAFERNKGSRKNFLSYSYVVYKFCELLGYVEFLPNLPLLKARQNLRAADDLWRKICDDVGYEFIPTTHEN